MRLQAKINIRFLTLMLLVFAVAGLLFYYLMGRVIDQNIREMLESRKAYVILNLQKNPAEADTVSSLDHSLFVRKIDKPEGYEFYADTLAYDQREKELIPFRKLTFTVKSGDGHYEVALLQSLLEMEDLRMMIFFFMGILFLVLMVTLFFVNRWLSAKTWRPFFKSLSVLRMWKFNEEQAAQFAPTGISEFDQLNSILEAMMQKIRTDFVNLKEFTENASHEMQTPLAIIKSKLELILQEPALDDNQRRQIKTAFDSAIRLSKLNEALLLLSKIENQQFVGQKEINFTELIRAKMDQFEELFVLKQIEVTTQLEEELFITMNPLLADILVSNLLSNALRHNREQGKVLVQAKAQKIVMANTGHNREIDATRLFRRFAKQAAPGDSNGLGLSIAYEICKSVHLRLEYYFAEGMHHFVLSSFS